MSVNQRFLSVPSLTSCKIQALGLRAPAPRQRVRHPLDSCLLARAGLIAVARFPAAGKELVPKLSGWSSSDTNSHNRPNQLHHPGTSWKTGTDSRWPSGRLRGGPPRRALRCKLVRCFAHDGNEEDARPIGNGKFFGTVLGGFSNLDGVSFDSLGPWPRVCLR